MVKYFFNSIKDTPNKEIFDEYAEIHTKLDSIFRYTREVDLTVFIGFQYALLIWAVKCFKTLSIDSVNYLIRLNIISVKLHFLPTNNISI